MNESAYLEEIATLKGQVSALTKTICAMAASEGAKQRALTSPRLFSKDVPVSDDLNTFLGNPLGTELSRSDVTKGVMKYARAHNLMDKQKIKADDTLRKLLALNEDQELTIMNLQKFLRRHYV